MQCGSGVNNISTAPQLAALFISEQIGGARLLLALSGYADHSPSRPLLEA
jgi:hypothetical protein